MRFTRFFEPWPYPWASFLNDSARTASKRVSEASQRRGGSGATPNSLQLHDDCAFQDSWSAHTSFAGILGDPLPCCPTALVGTSLVLVDRDREPSASGAHEGIAHETLYPRMRLSTSALFFSKRSKSAFVPLPE